MIRPWLCVKTITGMEGPIRQISPKKIENIGILMAKSI